MTTDATNTSETTETETTETQETTEAAKAEQKPDNPFADYDPRKAIYAKSDAVRFAKPAEEEKEETAEEAAEAEATEEKAEEVTEAEVVTEGEEKQTPREKRKAENLADKEKRLSAWEKKLVDQFQAADKPPVVKTVDTANMPLRHMTEDQVQARYDELALESGYRAQKFLRQVEAAKDAATRESEAERIDADFRDFRSSYPDVTESDWIRMNEPEFYNKYPDIIKAMEKGNHFAAFVAANAHLVLEKAEAERKATTAKETARDADIRKRNELKKKGTVLRVQTKAATPQPQKEERPKSKEELRQEYIDKLKKERFDDRGFGASKITR